MSRSAPKRRAETGRRRGPKPPKPVPEAEPTESPTEPTEKSRGRRALVTRGTPPVRQRATPPAPKPAKTRRSWRRVLLSFGALLGLAGVAAVVARALGQEPDWLGRAGSVALAMLLSAALAGRTGGRPFAFGLLAGLCSTAAVVTESDLLLGGATVGVVAIGSVLAVLGTVPATRIVDAVREVLVAAVVAGTSALAAYGFAAHLDLARFEYLTLGLAIVGGFVMIYRLGAGLHGLGTRGLLTVVVGTVLLAFIVAYAELLRRYGSQEVIDQIYDAVRWFRQNAGAVPRPIQVLVGIPALVWGTHMRARRRQGWWVCAFGTAATVSVGGIMVNPATGWLEAGLIVVYSLLPGLVLGYLLIRVDLLFTGPRGRRARREEEATAIRPEPARLQPLL